MAKSLTHSQFLQTWYNKMPIKNKAIEKNMDKIYEGLIDTIREEVRLQGQLNVKNLGKFYMIETGGYEAMRPTITGDREPCFVPKHYRPKFTCSQNFKDYVNDKIVSKEGRRRKKNGKLTELDKELEIRDAESQKTDIRRILERKRNTGESIKEISRDGRMKIKR